MPCGRESRGLDRAPRPAPAVVVVLLDLLLGRVLERDLLAGREAGENLDALESRHARLDRDHVEVLLPVIRQPDELGPAGEPRRRVGDLLGLQVLLQAVGDGLAVLALEALERDRDSLVPLLAQDLDVRAHPRAIS